MSITAEPQGGRRAATKAANRAAILAAARAVFSELGYGGATVRDVIRRTDLASGTFYNYFPDKESLFRAVLEETAEKVRARVQAARQEAGSVEEFVAAGYREYFGLLASDPGAFELMRRNSGTIRTMFDEPIFGAPATLPSAFAGGSLLSAGAKVTAVSGLGGRTLVSDWAP